MRYPSTTLLLALFAALHHVTAAPAPQDALPPPASLEPATFCRFVPERSDDFAWENDLIAFRAYGPAVVKTGGSEGSGIDCWFKRVKYPVINRWYEGGARGLSYHTDRGEGHDPYHTGASRGCGGLGIWKNNQLIVSGPYKEWKILSCEPKKSVFELTYEYDLNGTVIREVKRITIELGKRLFRVDATFTQDGKPVELDIAVGLTTHDGKATTTFKQDQGWMSCWEKIAGKGAGTGVVMEPAKIQSMLEIPATGKDTGHALLITRTDSSGTVTYYAGQAWEGAGEITTPEAWQNYLAAWPRQ